MPIAFIIGLIIAGLWGLADILSSHIRISPTRSTVIAQGSGMGVLILCGMVVPFGMGGIDFQVHSVSATLSLLVGLGLLAGFGYFSLYRAFQSCLPVGLVSSLVASNSAVGAGLSFVVFHDVNLFSVVLLLCGVVLIAGSVGGESETDLRVSGPMRGLWGGIAWSMAAALCLGTFNFGLGLASSKTGASYLLLLGSRAVSLLSLSLVLATARAQENASASLQKNMFLSVGVGIAEMSGLLLLSSASALSLSLTVILTLSSCSIVLPFGYSIVRGMRVQFVHLVGLSLILLGLISLSSKDGPANSVAILWLVSGFLAVWGGFSVLSPLSLWSRMVLFAPGPARVLMHASLKATNSMITKSIITTNEPVVSPSANDRPRVPSEGDGTVRARPTGPSSPLRRWILLLSLCGILLILGVGVFPFLLGPNIAYASLSPVSVGTLSFTSSGQVDPANTMGFDDGVQIWVHGESSPSAGQSYYVWLLPDVQTDSMAPLLAGTIPSTGRLSFTVLDHQNLLANFSRVVITQQASVPTPLVPQLSATLYQAVIPHTPTPGDPAHYSLLSHLRHLLAADPTLMNNDLAGGLVVWFYRDSEKVLEWASAARDSWQTQQTDLIHRQMIRILDALDGITYAYQDVPQGSPFLADPQASHFGLLSLFPTQDPPGLLPHVELHVQGVIFAPGHTPAQEDIVKAVLPALNQVGLHLQTVRTDARKLVSMSNDQLMGSSALALMDDLVMNANEAYVGEQDATTGSTVGGVSWIVGQIQKMAVFPVSTAS